MNPPDALPGETPVGDISGLIPHGVTTRAQLNELEAANILRAIEKYLSRVPDEADAPFELTWAYTLHGEMFGDVWRWAGQKRTHDLNLGVPHYQIDLRLHQLLEDLHYWQQHQTMPLDEQAVRLHHGAVFIHPFENGNGRWSRLLANIWLARHGQPIVLWPETTLGATGTIRAEYIAAIRKADAGDHDPLLLLHRKFAESLPT